MTASKLSDDDRGANGSRISTDVIIIGAGLGGTAAASVLARAGHGVVLIDTHAVYPPEFRAEKLGAPHLALLQRLGLDRAALTAATPIDSVDVYRFDRRIARHREREYGFAYSDLVNALRTNLPSGVAFCVGRVDEMTTGPDRQEVVLADGRRIDGRLIVVATGLGDLIRRKVGVERVPLARSHSLSLGFNLDEPASAYPFESMCWYGSGRGDRLAYLTLFPIGDVMRANLFVYREAGEAWTRAFRQDPTAELLALMPGLRDVHGSFGVAGRVQVRPIDLTSSVGYDRDGVVLVGDAFCTTCPVPGVGIQRVLTDVEQLCMVHVPSWLETPGMTSDKIATFYGDPVKTRSDTSGMQRSLFSRSMTVDVGILWTARRWRNDLVRRGLAWLRAARPSVELR